MEEWYRRAGVGEEGVPAVAPKHKGLPKSIPKDIPNGTRKGTHKKAHNIGFSCKNVSGLVAKRAKHTREPKVCTSSTARLDGPGFGTCMCLL